MKPGCVSSAILSGGRRDEANRDQEGRKTLSKMFGTGLLAGKDRTHRDSDYYG